MIHKNRTWGTPCTAAELAARRGETFESERHALAHYLTQYDWTTCTAFRYGALLFVSDAFAGGAGEFAVLRWVEGSGAGWLAQYAQIESITFGWCDEAKALDYIDRLVDGSLGEPGTARYSPRFHAKGETCGGCA